MRPLTRELFVEGTLHDLPQILDFVDDVCEQAEVNPDWRFNLQLAVEEACCNILEHAYGEDGGAFRIIFEAGEQAVKITIHDWGCPFDPAEIAPPDMAIPLEDRPIGGLGLFLIYKIMDDVRFTFSETGNTLIMIKHAEAPDGVADSAKGVGVGPWEDGDG